MLDPSPPRHRDVERMTRVASGNAAATVHAPVRIGSLRHLLDGEPVGLERAGEWAFSAAWLAELEGELREQLAAADSLDPGVPIPAAAWAEDVLPLLPFELRGAKLYVPGAVASLADRADAATELERGLDAAGVRATKVEDSELVRFLEGQGSLVRLGPEHAVSTAGYEAARDVMLEECRAAGEITIARLRDLLGVGRRDAQLFLERFDGDGLTRRVGDKRVLRAAGRATSRPSS